MRADNVIHQVGVGPADERQSFGLIVADGLVALARLGLYLQGDVAYLDRGLGRAHLQHQVDALTRADGDGDLLRLGYGKASGAGGDGVNAHTQLWNLIFAPRFCLCHRSDAGSVVGDGHSHVRNRSSAGGRFQFSLERQ